MSRPRGAEFRRFGGSFGLLSADVATSLAMIITELCQNAVEHGLADRSGEVRVVPTVDAGRLRVEISDDGRGLPADFDWRTSRSLGLSIVTTLVAEMEGTFELGPHAEGPGTRAVVGPADLARPASLTGQRVQDSLSPVPGPQCRGVRMSVRRISTALLATGLVVAVASIPLAGSAGAEPPGDTRSRTASQTVAAEAPTAAAAAAGGAHRSRRGTPCGPRSPTRRSTS